jgi:hypothetical protein
MAFDESKDKELWAGEIGDLQISVHSYNGGEAKLQIGPRAIETKSGEIRYRKPGRLTLDEFEFLVDSWDEVSGIMEGVPDGD